MGPERCAGGGAGPTSESESESSRPISSLLAMLAVGGNVGPSVGLDAVGGPYSCSESESSRAISSALWRGYLAWDDALSLSGSGVRLRFDECCEGIWGPIDDMVAVIWVYSRKKSWTVEVSQMLKLVCVRCNCDWLTQ